MAPAACSSDAVLAAAARAAGADALVSADTGFSSIVSGAAIAVRFARSAGEERLQLKWFAAAAVQADLASVVQQALEPVHVSMWRNTRG